MREHAGIPVRKYGARGRRAPSPIPRLPHASRHAIAPANEAVQIREITPSILADERYHAI